MLFSSKWAALLKPLLLWVFWRSRRLLHSSGGWGGDAQQGQQPQLPGARWMGLCCLCTPALGTLTHPTQQTLQRLPPSLSHSSLNCLWPGHSLQGKEFTCTGFLGIELLCQGRKNLLRVLGGKHKIPEKKHLLFEEQEQNASYQCLQIEWLVRFWSLA